MTIETKKLTTADLKIFKSLIRVFENVFGMQQLQMPADAYLQRLLTKDDFFAFVAMQGDTVVGGLSCYIMHQYYTERSLVYIYDLAVLGSYQRNGIGRKLIDTTKAYCRSINAEALMVEADAPDLHAIEFYRATGGNGQQVVHFDYMLDQQN